MNDDTSCWAAGVVRITDERLRWTTDKKSGVKRRAYNRDNKRQLNPEGLAAVRWLWGGWQEDLPENTLLHMPAEKRARVFAERSGQRRISQLFREWPERLIARATIATVAQQADPMKRARDARGPKHLGKDGVLVLGHQDAHPHIARVLGLPIPEKGEMIACRVVAVGEEDDRRAFWADGSWWAKACAEDPVGPAPVLPGDKPDKGWIAYLRLSGDAG